MKQGGPSQKDLSVLLFKITTNQFGILWPDRRIFDEKNLHLFISAHEMLKDIVPMVIRRAIKAWFQLGDEFHQEPRLGHLLEVGKRSIGFRHPKKLCPYSFSG
jgi:hypothetical protein